MKTTVEAPDTEAPTQPKGLHSMGTTASSVDLMWSPSDDNIGVDHYDIYRETKGSMEKLQHPIRLLIWINIYSNTTYKYVVKAVDVAGNESVQSDIFIITTKLKAFHMKNGMQRKHMKREIKFYTREKYMKQSKVIKEMGIQTGFMPYHYGKQCKLYLGMN